MNKQTFPVWYFSLMHFTTENLLELSFPQEFSKWVSVQTSFKERQFFFLPLSFAVCLTSWVIHSRKVIRNYHCSEFGADSLYCFLMRSNTNAASAEDQPHRPSSSHLSSHTGTIQMKKNLATPFFGSWSEDWLHIVWASSMKQKFFPIVWNGDVTHQLRRYQIPTCVRLNGADIQ